MRRRASIALGFLALIALGAVLLACPWAQASGAWGRPMESLFTACSAVCVTGLTVEHDVGVTEMTGFTELQTYVLTTMWNDASKDCQSLVREFIDFEYGAAAGEMAVCIMNIKWPLK